MAASTQRWLTVACLITSALSSYVDFGTITAPLVFEPTFAVPRPHHLPDDTYMRCESHHSHITAIAPSVKLLRNGSQETHWSLHFARQPTKTIEHQGLRKRGVFSGDPAIATCRPCDRFGNPTNNSTDSGTLICSQQNYDGVFRNGAFPTSNLLPDYCFTAGYGGPLVPTPIPTNAGLPCCPQCYPPNANITGTFTTGVLSPTGGPVTPATLPGGNGSGLPGGTGATVTITNTQTATVPGTSTVSTLSIETITPTGGTGAPTTATRLNTIIGCGTARGCGTVEGSGTVYLAPLGFPAVTSSGTVSGCAPTVIGCGRMLAASGTVTATGPPVTITACGEGTGSATLIGSGTVWPAGFMDVISFVSSGTVTGSGRVRGCGVLTGTGTFTVTEPYTTMITPGAEPTVNVYVSYCPPGPMSPLMQLAGNFSGDATTLALNKAYNESNYPGLSASNHLFNALGKENLTKLNVAGKLTSGNPLCHVCPEDGGICCPLFADCGADGHCPWTALEGSGYVRFGVNLVDVRNSSRSMGMSVLLGGREYASMRAPGLPGSQNKKAGGASGGEDEELGSADGDQDAALTPVQRVRKRTVRLGDGRAQQRKHRHDNVQMHRIEVGYAHGH